MSELMAKWRRGIESRRQRPAAVRPRRPARRARAEIDDADNDGREHGVSFYPATPIAALSSDVSAPAPMQGASPNAEPEGAVPISPRPACCGSARLRAEGFAAARRHGGMNVVQHLLDVAREDELRRPLPLERNFRRHRPFGAHAARARPTRRFSGLLIEACDRRRLVAAMGHAVGAFLVATGSVGVPVRRFHQLLVGRDVAFAEQIAGLLPAEDVARRHAPGRAVIFAVAGEEVEEQGRMHQLPLLALAEREDAAEQLLGLATVEEVVLVGRPLIGIAGRDRDADAEFLGVVEERRDVLGGMPVEDRRIDVDREALRLAPP